MKWYILSMKYLWRHAAGPELLPRVLGVRGGQLRCVAAGVCPRRGALPLLEVDLALASGIVLFEGSQRRS